MLGRPSLPLPSTSGRESDEAKRSVRPTDPKAQPPRPRFARGAVASTAGCAPKAMRQESQPAEGRACLCVFSFLAMVPTDHTCQPQPTAGANRRVEAPRGLLRLELRVNPSRLLQLEGKCRLSPYRRLDRCDRPVLCFTGGNQAVDDRGGPRNRSRRRLDDRSRLAVAERLATSPCSLVALAPIRI